MTRTNSDLTTTAHPSERLFATLCSLAYLKGFVFHSPKYYAPTEIEAGDVVLWVRDMIIVFEVVAHEAQTARGTRQFLKRIGEKRRQLVDDCAVYQDNRTTVVLRSEQGDVVPFSGNDLGPCTFLGVILIHSPKPLGKPHFESVRTTYNLPFPCAILNFDDFPSILQEVDTVADLRYYLADRATFAKELLKAHPEPFMNLNAGVEPHLLAFYKTHENSFPLERWDHEQWQTYWQQYRAQLGPRIEARNTENSTSFTIDQLIDTIRELHSSDDSTLVHIGDLASTTRRQRALGLGPRISDAFRQLREGRTTRHFAFFNQATACWSVFLFHYGGSNCTTSAELQRLCNMKLVLEIAEREFRYSVLGYGFRKATIETGNSFDFLALKVADARDYPMIPEDLLQDARDYFSEGTSISISEFPN